MAEPDVLSADLEVNEKNAFTKIDEFYSKLKAAAAGIDGLGDGSKFAIPFQKQLTEVTKTAEKTRQSFASLVKFDSSNNSLDGLSKSAIRLTSEAQKVAARLREIRAVDTTGKGETFLKILAEDAETAEKQLARLERRAEQLQSRSKSNSGAGGGSGIGEGVASGLGIPTSAGAGAALVAGGIVVGAKEALDASKDAANATLQLQAIAKQTGLDYQKLTTQAAEFGRVNIQSDREAEKTFAQIVNFANAAGRSDKIEEFRKRFSDLAAAKGINSSQLGEVSKQLNALTDEATDKLLNANPSAFYDKFAKSLGKTAEQLTDAEKRAAIFDEVLKRGVIFDGTAEKRLNDAAFATDKLAVKFDNLKAGAGKAVQPIAELLDLVLTKFGKIVTIQPFSNFKTAEEAAAAKENERIAADQRAKDAAEALRKQDADIAAARANPLGSIKNFALSKVNPALNFNDPAGRDKAIQAATADAEKFVADLTKRLESAGGSGSLVILKSAQKEFAQFANLFDNDTRLKIQKSLSDGISKGASDGFKKVLADTPGNVRKLQETLTQINNSSDLNNPDKSDLARTFKEQIRSQIQDGKDRIKELETQTRNLFEGLFAQAGASNPFVAVFSEADKAIEKVRLTTANLSEELQKNALALQETQNATNLFQTRLETGLSALGLRDDAARFRGSGVRRPTILSQDERDIFVKNSLARNDAAFGSFNNGRQIGDLTADEKSKIFQQEFLRGANDGNRNSFISALATQLIGEKPADANLTVQEKLQKQIDFVNGLGAKSDDEKAIADRKIIALTQGLDPATLTDRERSAAATARENEATRLEKAETAAAATRVESLNTLKSLDKNIDDLLKIARSEGLTGVIRIINEATDRTTVELGKRPNDRSTEKSTK